MDFDVINEKAFMMSWTAAALTYKPYDSVKHLTRLEWPDVQYEHYTDAQLAAAICSRIDREQDASIYKTLDATYSPARETIASEFKWNEERRAETMRPVYERVKARKEVEPPRSEEFDNPRMPQPSFEESKANHGPVYREHHVHFASTEKGDRETPRPKVFFKHSLRRESSEHTTVVRTTVIDNNIKTALNELEKYGAVSARHSEVLMSASIVGCDVADYTAVWLYRMLNKAQPDIPRPDVTHRDIYDASVRICQAEAVR